MAQLWNWTWLTVAFLSELAALAALAVWGWSASGWTLLRVVLAVVTPVAAAVLWGIFAAPHAPVRVTAVALLVKLVVFGCGVLALVVIDHLRLAIALATAALLSSLLSPHDATVSGPVPS